MRGFVAVMVAVSSMVYGPRGAAAQSAPQKSDSAGVPVFTNSAPKPNGPAFHLSTKPRVAIGQVEGAPEYQLFRATQGLVLGDGTIVVANTGTQELRFYDASGKYLHAAGKKGEGPGEFASLNLIGAFAGDSLLLQDLQLKRYTVMERTGKLVRTFASPAEIAPIPQTAGVLNDGHLVAFSVFIGPRPEASPRLREPVKLFLIGRDGRPVSSLGEFPGAEVITGGAALGMATTGIVFGRRLHVRARGNRIAIGNDDEYSVRIYDQTGKLIQVVRQTHKPVPVRPGDFEQALVPSMRPGGNANPESPLVKRLRVLYDKMYRYTTFPAFGGDGGPTASLRFDAVGNLWVQEFQRSDVDPTSWQAFDPKGAFMGRLDLPPKTTVLDIGADWALVRTLDDLDVEHVLLYGLERPR